MTDCLNYRPGTRRCNCKLCRAKRREKHGMTASGIDLRARGERNAQSTGE